MKHIHQQTHTATEVIDVADLDCIYLTYDEPKKEEFWVQIQNMVPWAKRVDGVKGSDAAHKAAADASDTDRFILIDGDNIPDPSFFNIQLELTDLNRDCVFRWKARNAINGLMYGNGGMSCWTKDFVYNMKTHEATDGTAENDVEFCFYSNYWAMNDCYSTTYPNGTPFQAWRAGFREGVKMCLDRGTKPSLADFEQRVHHRNYDHLSIWHNVGRDVENGGYAMMGARLGTYYTMLEPNWDYRQVQDFDYLKQLWELVLGEDPSLTKIGEDLKTRLGLPIVELDADQSKFFKHHYKAQFQNKGPMIRE
jgi:hypothetical protein